MNAMKKFILPLIIILLSFPTISTKGQSIGIDSMAQNLASLPDTINLNSSFTHTVRVINRSSTPLNGSIHLMAGVDTNSSGTIISIDTVGSTLVNSFGLNDTVSITYSETYSSGFPKNYKLGGNIVVVWPVATFATTEDSLFKDVFIINPTTIDDISSEQSIIYPNPTSNYLHFTFGEQNIFREIRIYDLRGKLILSKSYTPKIDIGNISSGAYILQLIGRNENKVYRFMKE